MIIDANLIEGFNLGVAVGFIVGAIFSAAVGVAIYRGNKNA